MDTDGTSRQLQHVIAAVRRLPGHERFGKGPQWIELTQAVEVSWPVVYVNPAPSGTLLLALWSDNQSGATAEATFVETSSTEVIMRMIVGEVVDLETPNDDGASYLFGIGHDNDTHPADFAVALDQLLPWLGEAVGRPIAKLLQARRAAGATLIVCGPLGLAPLHAASWETENGPRCLTDSFDIRFAPSAVIGAAALRRAARRRPTRLVALADPQGDLAAARPEVDEICAAFGTRNSNVAVGRYATAAFLRKYAARASHVHLACHARGGLFDAADAAVRLASGDLPVAELTTPVRLDARLVVVSACESALSEIANLPDEVVSIATALLAAGSACGIASLWPVDDLATALLMTRLYHELLTGDLRPPEALRRAQLWLRDLSEEDEQSFLQRHPVLAAEFERRAHSDRGAPGRRSVGTQAKRRGPAENSGERPYSHADYWAPFIAVGA